MIRPATWTLAPDDGDYPAGLADLPETGPLVLFGAGRREAVAGLAPDGAVTIVGARRASAYGIAVAERLAADLASAGVTIISGMALGIDGAAHRGALAAGGSTVAVLAGGPDIVYPARHRVLHSQIVATGAAVSEHPPGTVPRKRFFVARNRLMAALVKLVVIVEAAERSGTLITADHAQGIGRDVGAVPGRVGTRFAAGTNARIKEGAQLIRDAQDVLDLLAGVGAVSLRRFGPPLNPALRAVLEAVETGAATPDRLTEATALEPRTAAIALARLELLGYLARDLFGAYSHTGLAPPE